jgi:integrase
MGSRLVSALVMAELSQYISELSFERGKIFSENYNRRKWRQICKDAGLADFRFHDLRKAFCSMLAQNEIFHCCYPGVVGAFFTKSNKQGI